MGTRILLKSEDFLKDAPALKGKDTHVSVFEGSREHTFRIFEIWWNRKKEQRFLGASNGGCHYFALYVYTSVGIPDNRPQEDLPIFHLVETHRESKILLKGF